jgi:hypothetical protein
MKVKTLQSFLELNSGLILSFNPESYCYEYSDEGTLISISNSIVDAGIGTYFDIVKETTADTIEVEELFYIRSNSIKAGRMTNGSYVVYTLDGGAIFFTKDEFDGLFKIIK